MGTVRFIHRLSEASLWHWSSAVPTAEHRLPSTRSLSGEQQRTLSRGPQPFNCSMLNEAMWPQPYCSHGNVLLDIFFFLLQTVSPLTVLDTADAISPVVRTGHHPELLQGTSPAIFLWPWPIAAHPGRAGRYGSFMDHSFPSRSNSLLLSCRVPLRYCCDTLPSFWCEVAFHSFL